MARNIRQTFLDDPEHGCLQWIRQVNFGTIDVEFDGQTKVLLGFIGEVMQRLDDPQII